MKELMLLFACVGMLEGNVDGLHPDGVSYGPWGVTQAALDEVNAAYALGYTLEDMRDPNKALNVFRRYTDLVCLRNHWDITPANRLRAWHPTKDDYVQRGLNLFEDIQKKAGKP
jgi:hypothetical protein